VEGNGLRTVWEGEKLKGPVDGKVGGAKGGGRRGKIERPEKVI